MNRQPETATPETERLEPRLVVVRDRNSKSSVQEMSATTTVVVPDVDGVPHLNPRAARALWALMEAAAVRRRNEQEAS